MSHENTVNPKIRNVSIINSVDLTGALSDLRGECNYLERDCQSLGMRLGVYTGVHTRNRHEWEQRSDGDVINHLILCLAGERPHAEQSLLELAKEIAEETQFEVQLNELEIVTRTGINMATVLFIATLLGYDKNVGHSEVWIQYANCQNGSDYTLKIKITPTHGDYDYMLEFDLQIDQSFEYKESFIYIAGIPHTIADTIQNQPLTNLVAGPLFKGLGIEVINSSIDNRGVTKLTLDHNKPLTSLKDHIPSGAIV